MRAKEVASKWPKKRGENDDVPSQEICVAKETFEFRKGELKLNLEYQQTFVALAKVVLS